MIKKEKTIAGRLSRKITLWMFVILVGLSYFVIHYTKKSTSDFYSENYYNKTLINKEYVRRVLSDVYVAVINNIYYLEQNLNNPDNHKEVMRRIVDSGTRIRSCGVSFIEDYYPEKGHRFCPYAWKSPVNPEVIETVDMGDTALDYLNTDWFLDIVETDSALWSDPFYDGQDMKTTLTAYMSPIHDAEGRVVAVLGADVSLDWLTNKLNETDSTINENALFASNVLKKRSQSFIINHDGQFITHSDSKRILNDNLFNHIEQYSGSDVEGLAEKIRNGIDENEEIGEKYLYDGQKCYIFYAPVKYTDWTMVTVVPWESIDTVGILNGCKILLFIFIIMLVAVVACYYLMRNVTMPLKQLAKATNDIAKGKFDTPMPEIKHNDEIGQLRESLENMQYALSRYVNEKKAETPHKAEE